ncbi:hypothetical protein [Actinoplanes sp. NPDC051851]|uniref:hypothetical protein n=1 Tax=Actinoplanes sp. NPDC051851 TaxID=3154753 RepID=UPI003416652A
MSAVFEVGESGAGRLTTRGGRSWFAGPKRAVAGAPSIGSPRPDTRGRRTVGGAGDLSGTAADERWSTAGFD